MMPRPPLPAPLAKCIITEYARTRSFTDVAAIVGMSYSAVRCWLTRHGHHVPVPKTWRTHDDMRLRAMARAGVPVAEIAYVLGRTVPAIRRYAWDRKIALPRRYRKRSASRAA